MSLFNDRFVVLSAADQMERYHALAGTALRHYPAGGATAPLLAMEAFVCAAAISNLTFQLTIPSERESSLFRRNVCELADVFCAKLASNEPFVFG